MRLRELSTGSIPIPEDEFRRRHRGLVALLLAQIVALPVFGVLMGFSLGASVLAVAPAAVCAIPAAPSRLGRQTRSIACVLGLLCCSAALVWLWRGQTEAHFSYFVMVGAVALYEAALPYAIAILFVVLQHGLMGLWDPGRVFGSMAAMHHPWLWACVHGGFVAGLAAANIAFMRANQRSRQRERAANAASLAAAESFQRVFTEAPNGAVLLDAHGTILDVNASFARSMRLSADALGGRAWTDTVLSRDTASEPVRWPPPEAADGIERGIERGDGSTGWLLVTYSELSGQGQAAWVAQTVDISRRREAERRLAHQATHDPLTGLLNRRSFVDRAQDVLARPGSDGVCVLFVDIDDFKAVNDSLGHEAGDELLLAVADRLRATLRNGDLIARFGGDEFVACLTEPSPDDAEATASRVTRAFTEPFEVAGVLRRATASIGLTLTRSGDGAIDSLLRNADMAMYEAKSGGKARHAWFESGMRERALDRMALEADLTGAIERGEIEPFFQPQIGSQGRITGFEALARWHHPERGLVPPAAFIPIAEQNGLVSQIGLHVLRTACRQMRVWAVEDPRLGELTVSVNASPHCLTEGLVSAVAEVLTDTGVAPERVCIEVTETAVVNRSAEVQRTLASLKSLGVSIALDDFGAGQSTLAQISRLRHVDELKLDKALIDDIARSTTASLIVGALIQVAVADGLNVVAEGVEDEAQLRSLRALGCPTIQGFLFSPPVPAPAFRELLDTEAASIPA